MRTFLMESPEFIKSFERSQKAAEKALASRSAFDVELAREKLGITMSIAEAQGDDDASIRIELASSRFESELEHLGGIKKPSTLMGVLAGIGLIALLLAR